MMSRPLFANLVAAIFLIASTTTEGVSGAMPTQAPMAELSESAAPQADVTLYPTALAYVRSATPNTNLGGKGHIWVGYGCDDWWPDCMATTRGLAKFDIAAIPAGATITAARLRATITGSHEGGSKRYRVHSAVDPWTQSGVTWANKPTLGSERDSVSISATSGSVSWDVTNLVKEWYSGAKRNDGFYLTRESDSSGDHDRKFSDVQLVVTLTTAKPDLTIGHIEVVQVVQDWNNSIGLVQNKKTAVRVYVNSCCSTSNIANVGVKLEAFRTSGAPLSPANVAAKYPTGGLMSIPGFSLDPQSLRPYETKTFNFLLPSAWTAPAEIKLRATVDADNRVAESNETNNSQETTVLFNYRPKLNHVGIIVYGTTETGYTYPAVGLDHFRAHADWATRVHAVPGFTRWTTRYQRLEYDPAPGQQADGVLADLNEWRLLYEASDNPKTHAIGRITWYGLDSWSGFEPEFGAGRYFGLAWLNGYVATGMDTPANKGVGQVFAHEIAHNAPFGRLHASDQCTNWPHTSAGNFCDINYPLANGCIDEYGFDPVTMKVVRPDGASPCMKDLMAYGTPNTWISAYTYKALYAASANLVVPPTTTQATQATTAADPPYVVLLASGLITSDGGVRARPFYVARTYREPETGPGTGEYSLVLVDASDNPLRVRRFDLRDTIGPPDGPASLGTFGVIMPWHPDTARIALRKGDQTIGVRQVSANVPQVTLLKPVGGETWTGQQEVRWQGIDADGDKLTYVIMYSMDGGASWEPIRANLSDTSTMVNADNLPGSTQAKIRVIATDGVRSNHADSGILTVPSKEPRVQVTEPAAVRGTGAATASALPGSVWEYRFPYGIVLSAEAEDVEDGPLSGDSVVWTSSLDGTLGTGVELVVGELSPGQHQITVRATDSDGNQSAASFDLVAGTGEPLKTYLPTILK